jgi:curved DNA-binding protein CbpA
MLGGQGQDEADLWSLVQPASTSAPAPGGVQSFEEALRRVDSSLEALVGPPTSDSEQLVEPIIEAEVVSVSPGPTMTSRIEDLEGSAPMDSAEAARLRRQRLLKRAMENLGAMPPRPESSGSAITSSGSGISSSGSGITTTPTSAAPPAPSAADQQLAAQIEARHAQLSRKDLYLTLGIAPTATRDQVKAAFLNLAKIFHPDRLPPSLPHLAQKMSAVFEGIREAYETLHDDNKRAAWTAGQQNQPRPQTASQQAGDLFKMGEVFFKKRDYKQAEAHFARAHAADKGASSLAAQAWSIYMDPTRKAEGPAARQMMAKALTIDPNSDRAHYQLGVIGRVEGDMDRAEKHFREAVRANPKHLEANQELRLIEMRKKKADPKNKGGGGFFG